MHHAQWRVDEQHGHRVEHAERGNARRTRLALGPMVGGDEYQRGQQLHQAERRPQGHDGPRERPISFHEGSSDMQNTLLALHDRHDRQAAGSLRDSGGEGGSGDTPMQAVDGQGCQPGV